jgi:hypothetical protein
MGFNKRHTVIILGLVLLFIGPGMIFPEISIVQGVHVKILYDFSGSMYPGYPETPRHESGVKFFHEYPHFRQWLTGFVAAQTRFNARTVSMATFRSEREFQEDDINIVHPPVKPNQFDVDKAFAATRPSGVDFTYLEESLQHFTGDNFEGLVWMITDNRVEPGVGSGTTRDFFISLKDTGKYRSIHIYKLPFEDREKGQHANLAIYGILVSPRPIAHRVSQWYDQRFFELADTFKERQHLKLKDLSVEPIKVKIEPIEVDIEAYRKGITEGEIVTLPLSGTLKSNLTQHTIIGGTLLIQLIGAFSPDSVSKKKYGVEDIPGKQFEKVTLDLSGEIPPLQVRNLKKFYLKSKESVSLTIKGIGNLIKAATSGVRVKYFGKGVVSSDKIDVTIKEEGRKQITGIYSSGDIEPIFGSQASITEIKANPSEFDITFILKSGGIRALVLLLILILLMIPFALLAYFMSRKESYRVKKGDKEEMALVRRLGSYPITEEGILLGVLKRGLGNVDRFTPNTGLASLNVTPGKKDGEFSVLIDEKDNKKSFKLSIEPVNKSRSIEGKFDSPQQTQASSPTSISDKIPAPPGPGKQTGKTTGTKVKIRTPK